MKLQIFHLVLASALLVSAQLQAPAKEGLGAPISSTDRIYTGDQSSNTITVINPASNTVLGTISLGSPRLSDDLNPQYIRSVNAHGLGFSRNGKYIVSLSVTSNTVTVIRTLDNTIVSQTYVDRNAHEAFFAPDNRTIWVGTRGVDTVELIDGFEGTVMRRIESFGGPSKVLFSPDGKVAYVNHIRSPHVDIYDVETRKPVANVTGLADTFSSDMMLSADGNRLWVAHKMTGQVSVISASSQRVVGVLETGPETNHPNFAELNGTTYGFVTVAAENATKVYEQDDPEKMPVYVGEINSSGVQPHGLWPSPDNSRMYIVNEHSDTVDVVDLHDSFRVIEALNVGQEGQALIYVAGAVPTGGGTQNLGNQGLLGQTDNILLTVKNPSPSTKNETATALVTVRPAVGLDMFQVIGRNLNLDSTYTIEAKIQKANISIPLLDFKATGMTRSGCGSAPQVLAFFKFRDVYDLDSLQLLETGRKQIVSDCFLPGCTFDN
jgi:YVTN family beta-propeller protein